MPDDDILKVDPNWTTRRAPHMERYTDIRPVVVDGVPDAHMLWLKVGNQEFTLSAGGADYHETKAEAEWARDMLCIALDGMVREHDGLKMHGLDTKTDNR